jgi:hypothetical protein
VPELKDNRSKAIGLHCHYCGFESASVMSVCHVVYGHLFLLAPDHGDTPSSITVCFCEMRWMLYRAKASPWRNMRELGINTADVMWEWEYNYNILYSLQDCCVPFHQHLVGETLCPVPVFLPSLTNTKARFFACCVK